MAGGSGNGPVPGLIRENLTRGHLYVILVLEIGFQRFRSDDKGPWGPPGRVVRAVVFLVVQFGSRPEYLEFTANQICNRGMTPGVLPFPLSENSPVAVIGNL